MLADVAREGQTLPTPALAPQVRVFAGRTRLPRTLVAGLIIVLLSGCAIRPPPTMPTPTAPTVLAESWARCFGFTARLVLISTESNSDTIAPPAVRAVRGVRWRLEISGPADSPADASLAASLDTFTIRGTQANRADLANVRWSGTRGPVESLAAQGTVLLPEVQGAIEDGDQGRILAWIQTPRGAFGLRGIIFSLRTAPTGLEAIAPVVLPTEGCPTS